MNVKQRPIHGLSKLTEQKAKEYKNLDAESYPCSIKSISANGAIVTVKFEVEGIHLPDVKMPVIMYPNVRFPISVGDKGIARAGNRYLGGMSGLGGGVASDVCVGNLAGYQFEPVSNTEWVSVKTDLFTTLVGWSDNNKKTTPTQIYDKAEVYIAKINEIIAVVNAVHNAGIVPLMPVVDNQAKAI